MLTLYTKAGCPFCSRVVAVIDRLDIEVERKDIVNNEMYAEELIAHGGKRQVPYLVDTEKEIAMYESDDIVTYLQMNYGKEVRTINDNKPRIHISDSACVSCEG